MRYPCDRLAAFMAHCLNSEDLPLVYINPGALYARLTEAIAARYAEPLLHHPGYAWRLSAEEAAARYFDHSLARRLMLSGKVELSVAHRLFEAMCRRGAAPEWRDASLQREWRAAADNVVPLSKQGGFDQCARALARLPDTLSAGSASRTISARSGAVSLRAGNLSAPVPEEMSTWDAITCGPDVLSPLAPGEPFNRFCGLMIDCVRTAHRLFQELLGLGRGLCPFDWIDVLTIQQARALRKFMKLLDDSGGIGSESSWAIAWRQAPVPGFKTVENLRESEIGLALRHALRGGAAPSSTEEDAEESGDAEDSADAAEFLSEEEFRHQLELLQGDGVISATESRVLVQLHRGARFAELAAHSEVRGELRRRGLGQAAWLADLQGRIERWPRLAGREESL
jgi:hypothetical protein